MISIVIPTKNEEDHLPELLQSIRNQSVPPREVIVADASSTDRTREIAARFGARVVEGGMPGVGRNRGAAVATGDLMLFLDADVVLLDSTFLERSEREMNARGLDVATCDVDPMSDSRVDRALHGAYNTYVRALGRAFPHAPGFCLFARRVTHEAIGGFDETVRFCEDHDYARRAARVGAFGILRSTRIPVSVRRLNRDGRLRIAVTFALAELHLAVLGPIRHDWFRYTFGHSRENERNV